MTKAKKILYISQEIYPYLPENQTSKLCRELPEEVQNIGRETRIFMPRFGAVNERRNQLHEVIRLSGMNLIIDDTDHPLILKVASIQSARIQVYFIDNEDFFHRKNTILHDPETGEEFEDNDERAIFFVRGVLETVRKLRWTPDIVHCTGWFGALAPLYIKKVYHDDPFFKNSKVIYSIYDDQFQRPFRSLFAEKLMLAGITKKDVADLKKADIDHITLSKFAINYSDAFIQTGENANPAVLEYARATGKPFLPYQTQEKYVEEFVNFYDSLI